MVYNREVLENPTRIEKSQERNESQLIRREKYC